MATVRMKRAISPTIPTKHAHRLIDTLLDCSYLDSDFLFSLLYAPKLDDVLDFLGDDHPNVNHLIYAAFERVAKQFLAREVKRSAARFSCTEYTIFTNYLNSHLWFVDTELQRWFEKWQRHSPCHCYFFPWIVRYTHAAKARAIQGDTATIMTTMCG
jgi:hypothetical protein